MGFAPLESSAATAQLCIDLARLLAADGKFNVGLLEASSSEFSVAGQLHLPMPADVSSPWLIAPRLWVAPRESWWSQAGRQPPTGQNLQRLRELTSEFDFSIVHCPPVSALAMRVARCCDGLVLVLTANRTRRMVATQVKDYLHNAAIPLLGAVLAERHFPVPDGLYRKL